MKLEELIAEINNYASQYPDYIVFGLDNPYYEMYSNTCEFSNDRWLSYPRINLCFTYGVTKFSGYEFGCISKPQYKYTNIEPITIVDFLKILRTANGSFMKKRDSEGSTSIFMDTSITLSKSDDLSETKLCGVKINHRHKQIEMYSN